MVSPKVEAKAHALLTSGKVRCMTQTPTEGLFTVQGSDKDPYEVKYRQGVWWCDCPARVECSHLVAVRLVARVEPAETPAFAPEPELPEYLKDLLS